MRYSGNLTVRDNDVGWDEMKADEEDDAPTVAAVIDERPEELRIVLFFVRGYLELALISKLVQAKNKP